MPQNHILVYIGVVLFLLIQFYPIDVCRISAISMYLQEERKSSVDPDQLAFKKPADSELHCFQNRTYPGL